MSVRSNKTIAGMRATSSEPLHKDPQPVASMLQGAMDEVSRFHQSAADRLKLFCQVSFSGEDLQGLRASRTNLLGEG